MSTVRFGFLTLPEDGSPIAPGKGPLLTFSPFPRSGRNGLVTFSPSSWVGVGFGSRWEVALAAAGSGLQADRRYPPMRRHAQTLLLRVDTPLQRHRPPLGRVRMGHRVGRHAPAPLAGAAQTQTPQAPQGAARHRPPHLRGAGVAP